MCVFEKMNKVNVNPASPARKYMVVVDDHIFVLCFMFAVFFGIFLGTVAGKMDDKGDDTPTDDEYDEAPADDEDDDASMKKQN